MKIQHISKSEFNKIEGSKRAIVHDYPHQFALLDLGEPLGCYGLSWRSSPSIQPVVQLSKDRLTLWLGVDQRVAAIDLQDGHICLSLALHTHIFQIQPMEDFTIVLAELDLFLFNNSDCSIRYMEGLPEISAELTVSGSDLVIRLIDESRFILNLETYEMQQEIAASNQTR